LNVKVARIEMKSNNSWRIRLAQILLGAVIVIALVVVRGAKAGNEHLHLVTDWSHRHVVFSEPKSLMKRFELSSNHRYVQQWMRRNAERRWDRDEWRWRRAPEHSNHLQGDWSMDMGAGATVGADNYPAKFSFDPTSANCATPAPPVGQQPDFVVYNTSLAGSGTQATIVAFDNLYSGVGGCTGVTPQTYWAYNTGSTGAVVTSPVLSFDGSQVAFIQNTPGAATLVVLRWKANTGTLALPVTPATGSCTALTAPCQTNVTFSTANGDTTPQDAFSSPFYDYAQDTLYVGDSSGFLHKFTGVFLGTPTEVVSTAGTFWPATCTGGFGRLNSPVLDPALHEVLVTGSDGVLYAVDATAGAVPITGVNFTPKLANFGFDDGPLVDLTTGHLYVFARADITSSVASVFQFTIPATPSALHNVTGTEAIVSNSATIPASAFNIGTFDDAYFGLGGTGNLYVCSTSGTVNAIWGIPISSNVMGPPALGPAITTANVGCSPITEFNNTNTNIDRMYLSVAGSAVTGGIVNCPSNTTGCIMSYRIDSALTATTATSATASVTGGTSGIIIDNTATAIGDAQVYFTPLADQPCAGSGGVGTGTGGCAIQASQTGLN
jgi:hypothetical protein